MLISRTADGATVYYLYNGHGDVVTITDSLGIVAMTFDYDAFGVVTMATGSVTSSYLYAGYQFDAETGMYYLNSRYYDPVTARFMSMDTYLGQANDPLSLNLYTYCHNEPVMYSDPTGFADVGVKDSNTSQGNSVTWNGGTKGSRTITITHEDGSTATLTEGTDFYIKDNTAYYINDPRMSVGSTSQGTITLNNGKDLKEGQDYYIGNDGNAYYYSNTRTYLEGKGFDVTYIKDGSKSRFFVAFPYCPGVFLYEGSQYYIGADGKAHGFFGPPSPGPGKSTSDAGQNSGGPFNIDTDELVAMAISQVGYTEKDSTDYEYDVPTDAKHAGTKNYTKYGEYTEKDGLPWCASFVSWCINQVNPESSFKKSAGTGTIMNNYKKEGCYRYNNHTDPPHAGDLVIFYKPGAYVYDDKGNQVYNDDGTLKLGIDHCHIGIVVAYDPATNIVYTVEGNTSGVPSSEGCVNYHHYKLDSSYSGEGHDETMYIQGFCSNGGTSYGTITEEMKKSKPSVTII
jgi:RHS repeat-associated protein